MSATGEVSMDVTNDTWKKRRILALLDDALVPADIDKLKSFVSTDCRIVFPGFEGCGHAGVEQLLDLVNEVFDGCPTKSYDVWVCGRFAVNVHGSLYGSMDDGRSIDGTRYTDTFLFDIDGRISDWLVFNDLALLSTAKATP